MIRRAAIRASPTCSRRRDCHFTDIPSPSLLKPLIKEEGGQQNGSLADGYQRVDCWVFCMIVLAARYGVRS